MSAGGGKAYSMKEKKMVVDYLVRNNAYSLVKGKALWTDCPAETGTHRTWQSLKEVFLKRILPDISNPYFQLTPREISEFRRGAGLEHRKPLNWVKLRDSKSRSQDSSDNQINNQVNDLTREWDTSSEASIQVEAEVSVHAPPKSPVTPAKSYSNSPSPNINSISPAAKITSISPSTKASSISPVVKDSSFSPKSKDNSFSPSGKATQISPVSKATSVSLTTKDRCFSPSGKPRSISSPGTPSWISPPTKATASFSPARINSLSPTTSISSTESPVAALERVVLLSSSSDDSDSDMFIQKQSVKTKPKFVNLAGLASGMVTVIEEGSRKPIFSKRAHTASGPHTSTSNQNSHDRKGRPTFALYDGRLYPLYYGNSPETCRPALIHPPKPQQHHHEPIKTAPVNGHEEKQSKGVERYMSKGFLGVKSSKDFYGATKATPAITKTKQVVGKRKYKYLDDSEEEQQQQPADNRNIKPSNTADGNDGNTFWKIKYMLEKKRNNELCRVLAQGPQMPEVPLDGVPSLAWKDLAPSASLPQTSTSHNSVITISKQGQEILRNVFMMDTQKTDKLTEALRLLEVKTAQKENKQEKEKVSKVKQVTPETVKTRSSPRKATPSTAKTRSSPRKDALGKNKTEIDKTRSSLRKDTPKKLQPEDTKVRSSPRQDATSELGRTRSSPKKDTPNKNNAEKTKTMATPKKTDSAVKDANKPSRRISSKTEEKAAIDITENKSVLELEEQIFDEIAKKASDAIETGQRDIFTAAEVALLLNEPEIISSESSKGDSKSEGAEKGGTTQTDVEERKSNIRKGAKTSENKFNDVKTRNINLSPNTRRQLFKKLENDRSTSLSPVKSKVNLSVTRKQSKSVASKSQEDISLTISPRTRGRPVTSKLEEEVAGVSVTSKTRTRSRSGTSKSQDEVAGPSVASLTSSPRTRGRPVASQSQEEVTSLSLTSVPSSPRTRGRPPKRKIATPPPMVEDVSYINTRKRFLKSAPATPDSSPEVTFYSFPDSTQEQRSQKASQGAASTSAKKFKLGSSSEKKTKDTSKPEKPLGIFDMDNARFKINPRFSFLLFPEEDSSKLTA